MVYPMDKDRNFLKSLVEYLETDEDVSTDVSEIITGH